MNQESALIDKSLKTPHALSAPSIAHLTKRTEERSLRVSLLLPPYISTISHSNSQEATVYPCLFNSETIWFT
jgi:hypothetical protein